MSLLDILQGVGHVIDTPGSVVRGLLSGSTDRAFGGIFDPSRRVSGRDLTNSLGLTDEDSGLGGDVAGMAAGLATDPLMWGGGALLKMLGRGGEAAAAGARGAEQAGKAATEAVVEATTAGKSAIAPLERTKNQLGVMLEGHGGTNPIEGYGGINTVSHPSLADLSEMNSAQRNTMFTNMSYDDMQQLARQHVATPNAGPMGIEPLTTERAATMSRIPPAGDLPSRASLGKAATEALTESGGTGAISPLLQQRRGFTMLRDLGTDAAGEPTGRVLGRMGDNVSRAAEEYAYTAAGAPERNAAFYPSLGVGVLPEGVGSNIARHETMHGLVNNAVQTQNATGLPLLPRAVANAQMSNSPVLNALGHLGEETVAHGAESRGGLDQLRNMMQFLSNPHSGYVDQFNAYSPLAARMYGSAAIPRLGLAGYGTAAAGGASALAALLGGNE